jgi:hypothetical protein
MNPRRKAAELELTPRFAAHVGQIAMGESLPHEKKPARQHHTRQHQAGNSWTVSFISSQ